DGIRDLIVTGVQTCALPIFEQVFAQYQALRVGILRVNLYWGGTLGVAKHRPFAANDPRDAGYDWSVYDRTALYAAAHGLKLLFRSEERRVGKEGRSRGWPDE